MGLEDCIKVLKNIGLEHHSQHFRVMQVDGPLLEATIHPHVGKQILMSLGIEDDMERNKLVNEVRRLKSGGYNICHSTVTA